MAFAAIAEGSDWQLLGSAELPPNSTCAALAGHWHGWNAVRRVCAYHNRNKGAVSHFVAGRRRLAAGGR
jgi:hypothetical protein